MAKAGKWLRSFLSGKKDKEKEKGSGGGGSSSSQPSTPAPSPATKEKKRWSFRRSPGPGKEANSAEKDNGKPEAEAEQKKHAMAVAAATAAAADAAVVAAQAAAVVVRLAAAARGRSSAIEEAAAAVKIQAVFRSYLARKALRALKGLVKLQALIRGHLVRRQATETLRCMQALVTAQARARAQRIRMIEEGQRQSAYRRSPSPQNPRFRQGHDMDRFGEDNAKIVEMDLGVSRGSSWSRNSYSASRCERTDHRFSAYYGDQNHIPSRLDYFPSPAPSALTDMSPRACSGHFEEFSFKTAQSSPHYFTAVSKPDFMREQSSDSQQEDVYSISNDYPLYPNYMSNTESSRAKARSQSAPKQRPETYERQPSKRRPSIEGRNIPRAVRMQRSSSHVGSSVSNYQYPWSIKLDRSNVSLKDSECGSTSTVLTNTNYCRSLVPYEAHGSR